MFYFMLVSTLLSLIAVLMVGLSISACRMADLPTRSTSDLLLPPPDRYPQYCERCLHYDIEPYSYEEYCSRLPRLKPVPNFCPECGYNLTGNVSGRCSECGWYFQ